MTSAMELMAGADVSVPKNPLMYLAKSGAFIDPIRFIKNDPKYIGNIDFKTELTTEPFKFTSAEHGEHVRHTIKKKDAKYSTFLLPPMVCTQVALGPDGNFDPTGSRYKQGSKDPAKAKFSAMGVPTPFDAKVDDGTGMNKHFRFLLDKSTELDDWVVDYILHNPNMIPSEVRDTMRDNGKSDEEIKVALKKGSTGLVHEKVDEEATKTHPLNAARIQQGKGPAVMIHIKGSYYVGMNQDVYFAEAKGADGKALTKKRRTEKKEVVSGMQRRDPPTYKLALRARADGSYAYEQVLMKPYEISKIRDGDVFVPEITMAISPDAKANKFPTKPFSIIVKMVKMIWLGPGASARSSYGVSCELSAEEVAELKAQAQQESGLVETLSKEDTALLDAMELKTPLKKEIPPVTLTEEEKQALAPMETSDPESPVLKRKRADEDEQPETQEVSA